jgi:alpha-D-ribose 1-methylphosphonate 5-triphosphate synthase subunit PhnG
MEFQLLITKMGHRSIEKLIGLVPENEIDIVKMPETGLLMMAVKDSFETEFYLGEILVTEAEVRYSNKKGYSMIMGDEPERAIAAAVVDAIMRSDNKALITRMNKLLLSWERRLNKNDKRQEYLTAKTKVNFENMRKEHDPNSWHVRDNGKGPEC